MLIFDSVQIDWPDANYRPESANPKMPINLTVPDFLIRMPYKACY